VAVQPFRIDVSREVLGDLHQRLARTRWVDDLDDKGWKYGLSIPYMRESTAYWQTQFDWRAQERTATRSSAFT